MQQLKKFVKQMIFPELAAVYEHYSGIKVFLTLYTKYLLHIVTKYFILRHYPVRAHTRIEPSKPVVIHL